MKKLYVLILMVFLLNICNVLGMSLGRYLYEQIGIEDSYIPTNWYALQEKKIGFLYSNDYGDITSYQQKLAQQYRKIVIQIKNGSKIPFLTLLNTSKVDEEIFDALDKKFPEWPPKETSPLEGLTIQGKTKPDDVKENVWLQAYWMNKLVNDWKDKTLKIDPRYTSFFEYTEKHLNEMLAKGDWGNFDDTFQSREPVLRHIDHFVAQNEDLKVIIDEINENIELTRKGFTEEDQTNAWRMSRLLPLRTMKALIGDQDAVQKLKEMRDHLAAMTASRRKS